MRSFGKFTCAFIFVNTLFIAEYSMAGQADLQGKPATTSYSGKSESQKSSFTKTLSDNDAIASIEAAERSDDPCYLQIKYRDLVSGAESSQTYDECSGNEGDREFLSMPEGAFVTGVRVCLNSGEDKIKGIQLIGNYGACLLGAQYVEVQPAGCSSTVKISGQDYRLCSDNPPSMITRSCSTGISPYFERTNCQGSKKGPDNDWESTVKCPSGKVATGMKLNTRESGGGRRMFNGIALDCLDLVDD